MGRPIRWFLLALIVLLFVNTVVSDPVSGWHPSARDFFQSKVVYPVNNESTHAIIPPLERDLKNTQPGTAPSQESSPGLITEAVQIPSPEVTRILVRYNESEVSALSDISIEGVSVIENIGSSSLPGLVVCNVSGISPEEAVQKVSGTPGVLYAEPDYVWTIASVPNDPEFWRQWGMQNTGQTFREGFPPGKSGSDAKMIGAWDITTGSGNVLVAVLDTGVDYTHPDIVANMWTGPNGEHGYDVINQDSDPMDDYGHGTHCAGIIGAVGNNGIGTTGVAWNTKIVAIKAINNKGTAFTSDIIKGIEYSKQIGADIVSCSFGGGEYSQTMHDVIAGSPALFVCAAGNGGQNNDITPYYPSSYPLENIISVAGTSPEDTLVATSNYGTSVDVAAPGYQIYSTALPQNGGERYRYLNGTSQAAAMVAGMSALISEADAALTPREVRDLLVTHSDAVSSLAGKVVANGRVNLTATLKSLSGNGAILLHPGWNFVSVPRPLALGSDTASIFAGVSSGGHSILTYNYSDGWKSLKATDLLPIMTGYWIYSTKEDSVTLKYQLNPVPVKKEVIAGWNTYGIPGMDAAAAKDALSPVKGVWKYVVGYDATLQQYETPILNDGSGDQDDDRLLQPTRGYWLYSAGAGSITG